jgi:lipoate-protein ligase A
MRVWRWLDSGTADGATHMSLDAALLRNPSGITVPTLRIYGWRPRCISLGIHQPDLPIHFERCRSERVDVVRRPTGGRAVFHSDEITYSLVIPKEAEWYSRSKHDLYRVISSGIEKGLRDLGLPVEYVRRSAPAVSPADPSSSISCFSSSARWEILLAGKKLVGSAQRLTADGFLQQGSILTGSGHSGLMDFFLMTGTHSSAGESAGGKNAISIEEFAGRKISRREAAVSLRAAMEAVFSIRFGDSELTGPEKRLAESSRDQYSVFDSGGSDCP